MLSVENDANLIAQTITNSDCATYSDIARISGLSLNSVSNALWWLRSPETAKRLGWTIPHSKRGPATTGRRYMVVGLQGQTLTPDDHELIGEGEKGTLMSLARTSESQAHAMRVAARMTQEARRKKRYGRLARKMENTAVEAGEMLEDEFGIVLHP